MECSGPARVDSLVGDDFAASGALYSLVQLIVALQRCSKQHFRKLFVVHLDVLVLYVNQALPVIANQITETVQNLSLIHI